MARDLAQGTVVAGRYEVQRRVGSGGMGNVYAATQLRLKREIALKVILPEYAAKQGARRRFEREARVASALNHPNAIEIYDFGDYEDTLYLAMELLHGPSLRSIVDLDKPPLTVRRACRIGAAVADVLASAGAIGLIHRDLKPENIILDRSRDSERVVVVDFGLAFINDDGETGRMTREGVVTGTPDYMSPEQARGVTITPAADVYALGCLLYEMLTARVPFDGDATIILSRHLFVAPTPMREFRPDLDIPGSLDELVMRMLSKSPEDRPDAGAVRDALTSLDPDAPQRSGAAAGGQLVGRAARMVSEPPLGLEAPPHTEAIHEGQTKVAVTEAVDAEFQVALAVNGLDLQTLSDGAEAVPMGVRAVFAPSATPETVSAMAKAGVPVITDSEANDLERLAAMLRAGAAEVVIRPCSPGDVARKIWRAIRKA